MRCYHRTTAEAAVAILADGFRDAERTYMTTNFYRGVWLSNAAHRERRGAG
jgi:hypothetical protein